MEVLLQSGEQAGLSFAQLSLESSSMADLQVMHVYCECINKGQEKRKEMQCAWSSEAICSPALMSGALKTHGGGQVSNVSCSLRERGLCRHLITWEG